MNLALAPNNKLIEVISIKDNKLLEDALRFGIEVGNFIKVISKLPGGPVIIQKDEQQLAIGRELAKAIEVRIKN